MVLVIPLERKSLVNDLSGREKVEGYGEEQRNHHEAFPQRHSCRQYRSHDNCIYFSVRHMLHKQKVSSHPDSYVDDHFSQMHSEEDLVHSPLCRILEIIDQGENQLMVYVAEDD